AGSDTRASIAASAGVNVSFATVSPTVIAIGKGDRRADWVLENTAGPLVGDQQLCFTALAPIVCEELQFTACVSATVGTFDFLPFLMRTEAIPLVVELK